MNRQFDIASNTFSKLSSIALPLIFWALFTSPNLQAQATPEQRLIQAYTWEREGNPQSAITEIQELLSSKALDPPNAGKAWNILALAYEDQADFALSQHAYEQSLSILATLPNNIQDYAMALNGLGGLYVTTGQLETAAKVRTKALQLYEKLSDHTGIARTNSDLAGVAFSQDKVHQGKKYLDRALQEAQLANALDEDDRASIFSMQGWLAQLDENFRESISRYQQSLALWKKSHGEEHPFTGWGYMLVGEAYANTGDLTAALKDIKQGLAILEHTLGTQNPRYLTAEMTYSRVLDKTGAHAEAAQIKAETERLLKQSYSRQCAGCTVSATAFH